jgi:hypothetical protein
MVFDDNEAKLLAERLVERIEFLMRENIALTSILEGVDGPDFQSKWAKTLEQLLAREDANRALRAKLQPLYDAAQRKVEAGIALELLKSLGPQKTGTKQ